MALSAHEKGEDLHQSLTTRPNKAVLPIFSKILPKMLAIQ